MKVVHLNRDTPAPDPLQAEIILLEKLIREHPGNTNGYNRLMILYRKQKEYKKELRLIDTAIRVFEEKFRKKQPRFNKKVTSLSKALLKATGLADKKGNNIYEWGELAKWKKRKELLLRKNL